MTEMRVESADHASGRTSRCLQRLAISFSQERVSVGELFDGLGRTGLGLMMIVLAIPSFLPVPGVPLGAVFGSVIVVICLQILVGANTLVLPQWLRRRTMPRAPVVGTLHYLVPWVDKVERRLRPRFKVLTRQPFRALLALPILVLAIAIVLPIPLGNQLPAIAIAAFGFGLIVRDGLAIISGFLIGIVAVIWNVAVILFGTQMAFALVNLI